MTSKAERVLPTGARAGSTAGSGGGPLESVSWVPKFVVSVAERRNGGFCAFEDDVPPGPQFQKTPKPPRTIVRPSPRAS